MSIKMKKSDLNEMDLFCHNIDGNQVFFKMGVKSGKFRVWPDKKVFF